MKVIRIATTAEDRLKCCAVRSIVFVEEQQVPYAEEIDSHEDEAIHILVEIAGEPAGAARIRFGDDHAKLERIAIRRSYRGRGLGRQLVDTMLEVARQHGHRKFQMHAQAHLCDFYRQHGFQVLGELFVEAGIDHYLMVRNDESER